MICTRSFSRKIVSISSIYCNSNSSLRFVLTSQFLRSQKTQRVSCCSCRSSKLLPPSSQPSLVSRCKDIVVRSLNTKSFAWTYPKALRGNLKTMKLESSHFKELFTPELNLLYDIFTKNGYEIRMAGGAVRDLLVDKKPADIDFATTATPDQMKEMFEKETIRMINAKGEQHGTVTARINDKENFEVTTLRIDVVTDGRHAQVEFTKNWELDAGRRDLTINSMFLGFDGTVYDYFNGIEDLENRVVKFVGNPIDRIQEDYLRILRYFRFYGRISTVNNKHEEATIQAIKENVTGLQQISGERLWMELRKILQGNYYEDLLLKMLEVGVGPYIGLPQVPNIEEFKMFCNRLRETNTSAHPVTLISALLHDETEALKLHSRLKLSAFERDLCLFVILHRNREAKRNGLRYFQAILITSKSKAKDVKLWIEETLRYDGNLELLQQFQDWDPPKFPVSGHVLINMKLPPGKSMTLVLNYLRNLWIDSNFTMTEEELVNFIPKALDFYKITPKK